jgi:hypothetical protein
VEADLQKDFVLANVIEQLKSMNVSFIEPLTSPSTPPLPPVNEPIGPLSYAPAASAQNINPNIYQQVPQPNYQTNPYSNYQSNIPNPYNPINNNMNYTTIQGELKKCPAYHVHPLRVVANPKTIYPPHGQWFCDICTAPSTPASQMHHCMDCGSFDMCGACFGRGTAANVHYSVKHAHPLTQCDPNVVYAQFRGKWHCNICRKNNQPEMFHCFPCKDFDMCGACAR